MPKCDRCGKNASWKYFFEHGRCKDCQAKFIEKKDNPKSHSYDVAETESPTATSETTVKEGSDTHASDIVSLSQNQVEYSFSGVQLCLILSGGFLALILLISGLWYVGQYSDVVKSVDNTTKVGADLRIAAFQNLIGLAFLRFAQVGFTAAITWALVILLGKFDQK